MDDFDELMLELGAQTASRPSPLPLQVRAQFPILPRTLVARDELWQRLDVALTGAATMVAAPAGAGKTLGAAGWVQSRGLADSTVWVPVSPDLGAEALATLLARQKDQPDRLLVLDDAHRLPPDALSLLDHQLLTDPGALHVLLLGRWDLPLSRLVPELLGHLTVLRGGALRLTPPELEALVQEHARTDSPEVVEAVGQLADGWCAIAVLAAKAVRAERDPVTAVRRMLHQPWPVGERVLDEAFSSLTSQQRHLLLCVASEPLLSTSVAQHLTQDPGAEQALGELESTGLLVARREHRAGQHTTPEIGEESTFEIHPLLREVIHRRIRAGGVDVIRASASVRRAVASDVAQGQVAGSFRRLAAMSCAPDAVDLLATHGIELVERGALVGLRDFLAKHPADVDRRPEAFLPIALERWWVGDVKAALPWLHRFLHGAVATGPPGTPSGTKARPGLEVACARLLLARSGEGDVAEAVVVAEKALLTRSDPEVDIRGIRELVTYLAGTANLGLGHVGAAQRHLGAVAAVQSAQGPSVLTLAARAQLALTLFLLGREHVCLGLAENVLRDLRQSRRRRTLDEVRKTVDVARGLAVVQRVLVKEIESDDVDALEPGSLPEDPVVAGLARLLSARMRLLHGSVAQAEQALLGASRLDAVPPPLARLVTFEQTLQAVLGSDWRRVGELEVVLTSLGATDEAVFVAALRADGLDDIRTAIELHTTVAGGAKTAQPPIGAMAQVCLAQLLDAQGHHDEALPHLTAAVTATEARRNALPFLGWSAHGTPVAALLHGHALRIGTSWARHVAAETARNPGGILSAAEPLTPTPQERAQVPDGVLRPSLSPRERDVLRQLARGATYADIAAHLYVSENTVKTHVSSLYAKLAVSRRSDALAVARTMQLL